MRLLCLHGFLGSPRDFDALHQQGHNIWAPDLASRVTSSTTWLGLCDELLSEVREPHVVVGYSMGARLGLALALRAPWLIAAAVVVSASPGLKTAEERTLRRTHDQTWMAQMQQQPPKEFLNAWYRQSIFASFCQHPSYPEHFLRRSTVDVRQQALVLERLGLGAQPSLWDALEQLQVPVYWMCGALDTKFVAIGKEVSSVAPNIQLRVVANAGHVVHLEEQDAFLKCVSEALEGVHHGRSLVKSKRVWRDFVPQV